MAEPARIAVAQIGSVLGDVDKNLARVGEWIRSAADDRISLVVFPECTLSGYMFENRAEVEAASVVAGGRELAEIVGWCRAHKIIVVVGYLERASDGIFNTASVIGPDEFIGTHRKQHLPMLGADRFVNEPTDVDPSVFNTPIGRVGVAICYEIRFPEVFRTLALAEDGVPARFRIHAIPETDMHDPERDISDIPLSQLELLTRQCTQDAGR